MTNVEIVKYNPIYDDQICELEKAIWRPDSNVNRSFLQWKYFDNPYSDSPKIYLALHDGQVIAIRGFYEAKWQVGGKVDTFMSLCASDAVVHQDFRGTGIYRKLMDAAIEDLHDSGCRYLFSFSANPVNVISSLAMGWKSIASTTKMRKELTQKPLSEKLKIHNLISVFLKRTGVIKSPYEFWRNHTISDELRGGLKKLLPYIKFDTKPKPAEMSALAEKLANKDKITFVKDQKFYSWRYNNPFSEYLFLYWIDDDLKGYVTVQTARYRHDSMRYFNILELEGIDLTIKVALLNSLIDLLGYRSISIWTNTIDENIRRFLLLKQFRENAPARRIPETHMILAHPMNERTDKIEFQGVDLLDSKNWDFQMIYSDSF